MKKISVITVFTIFLISAVVVGATYHAGTKRKPLIYTDIPDLTVNWLEHLDQFRSVFGSIDKVGPFDWENTEDYGQSAEDGWKYIEDENIIVYYKPDQLQLNLQNARRTLHVANEAIPEIQDLMGGYPFPNIVNGRKLPIYMAPTDVEYASTINVLCNKNCNSAGSLGMYIFAVGPLGCKTDGIVLHPSCYDYETPRDYWMESVLRHEMNHFAYFSFLNYGKEIDNPLWVSEGLAEYASLPHTQVSSRDSIDYIANNCSLGDEFPEERLASYWAGKSFYVFLEHKTGGFELRKFIQNLYQNSIDSTLYAVFPNEDVKEMWIEDMMDCAGLNDSLAVDPALASLQQ